MYLAKVPTYLDQMLVLLDYHLLMLALDVDTYLVGNLRCDVPVDELSNCPHDIFYLILHHSKMQQFLLIVQYQTLFSATILVRLFLLHLYRLVILIFEILHPFCILLYIICEFSYLFIYSNTQNLPSIYAMLNGSFNKLLISS